MMIPTTLRLSTGLALLALAACTSLSPAGLIAASRLDPLTTPPERITVALGVPDTLRLSSRDAVLAISFKGAGTPPTLIAEVVPLQLEPDVAGAVPDAAPGETVYIASLLPRDAARFARAQSDILLARERGIDGPGTLSVAIAGGCFTRARPETLPLRTWLRTDPARPFVPLTRRVDAFRAAGDGGALRHGLAPCEGDPTRER